MRDLQSRNGTRVNGIPVDERQLFHGDQLSVGSSVLMFLSAKQQDEEVHGRQGAVCGNSATG